MPNAQPSTLRVWNPRRAFLLGMMTQILLPNRELLECEVRRLGQLSDQEATPVMTELLCALLEHPLRRSEDGSRRRTSDRLAGRRVTRP